MLAYKQSLLVTEHHDLYIISYTLTIFTDAIISLH